MIMSIYAWKLVSCDRCVGSRGMTGVGLREAQVHEEETRTSATLKLRVYGDYCTYTLTIRPLRWTAVRHITWVSVPRSFPLQRLLVLNLSRLRPLDLLPQCNCRSVQGAEPNKRARELLPERTAALLRRRE